MKIELRKLNVNQRLSEETLCYSADLYVDGRYAGYVANRGCGGCDEQHIEKWTSIQELDAQCKVNYPAMSMAEYKMDDIPADLEQVCHAIASRDSEMRRFKRSFKSKVVFIDGKNVVRELSWKGVKQITETHLAKARELHPDVRILNSMDDTQLLEVLTLIGV